MKRPLEKIMERTQKISARYDCKNNTPRAPQPPVTWAEAALVNAVLDLAMIAEYQAQQITQLQDRLANLRQR